MIDVKALKKEDIGKWVLFTDGCGKHEKGRIKSWNDVWIFVVYNCDFQWDKFQDYTGCATRPDELDFTNKGKVV